MIRVRKSDQAPESLSDGTSYGEDDVRAQLFRDQDTKCYICERRRTTDLEVEHVQSQKNNLELKFDWSNLLFACSYCNRKKSDSFDTVYSPTAHDIELEIAQTFDLGTESVFFNKLTNSEGIDTTIELLTRIYNGTKGNGQRRFNELNFYKEFSSNMILFIEFLTNYKQAPTEENKTIIIESLQIEKENLAFKYHLLKSMPELFAVFEEYMVWNRVG